MARQKKKRVTLDCEDMARTKGVSLRLFAVEDAQTMTFTLERPYLRHYIPRGGAVITVKIDGTGGPGPYRRSFLLGSREVAALYRTVARLYAPAEGPIKVARPIRRKRRKA